MFFQVSNQTTLGEKEGDVIERLNKVILQIIEHEENARITLLEKKTACRVRSSRSRVWCFGRMRIRSVPRRH